MVGSDKEDLPELRQAVTEPANSGAQIFLCGHDEALKVKVDLAVVSPGVPLDAPVVTELRRQGVPVIGEVELGWRHSRGRFAAVTGSNGKTTTTALLGEIFAGTGRPAFTCGNIGLPLSEVADRTTDDSLLSVEVSSFQLDTIVDFKPDVAVLLNISPDHLDRHGGLDEYARAKSRLWMNQSRDDWLIYFADDPVVVRLVESSGSGKFPFSLERRFSPGAYLDGEQLVVRLPDGEEYRLERNKLRPPGRHNAANALAAAGAALLLGVEPEVVTAGVEGFHGVPHRFETVRELEGVVWINDSKATNVDAGLRALEAVGRPVVLIAGGRAKGGGFSGLKTAPAGQVRRMILIGEAAAEIERDLDQFAPIELADTMADAVKRARLAAQPGDAVLLSPLCASFDMFRNFEERGNIFKQLVMELS